MTNPALNPKIFQKETAANQQPGAFEPGWGSPADELPPNVFDAQAGAAGVGAGQTTRPPVTGGGDTMRISGTMTATGILLLLLMVAGWFGWQAVDIVYQGMTASGEKVYDANPPSWIFLAWIGTFVLAMVTIFKPRLARITAPIYAVGEGLALGSISAIFEAAYPGIVVQAVLLTFGVFITMMVLFATGAIRVTEKLRMCIFASMGAIMFVYIADLIASLFGSSLPIVNSSSPWGIGFSVVVVIVASLNLLLNFDFIKTAVDYKAPRYMEWFAAFGLMLALVWLYLEILRLLSKLRN
ncbi:MAG TPA: Bax inhibitor-1/YccA family protein [Acidimicrobiales bacterium]|nr:Bax inhibitor-1/YccA family protein [Acidimicrobiales bacterium]